MTGGFRSSSQHAIAVREYITFQQLNASTICAMTLNSKRPLTGGETCGSTPCILLPLAPGSMVYLDLIFTFAMHAVCFVCNIPSRLYITSRTDASGAQSVRASMVETMVTRTAYMRRPTIHVRGAGTAQYCEFQGIFASKTLNYSILSR